MASNYFLIKNLNQYGEDEDVAHYLSKGWKLAGGPVSYVEDGQVRFAQALYYNEPL